MIHILYRYRDSRQMGVLRICLLLLLFSSLPSSLFPQNPRTAQQTAMTIIDQATDYFNVGQFDECLALLQEHEAEFSGQHRVLAYRMMTIISMYHDDDVASERYANLLLRQDPFYSGYNDTPRFRDLLARLKKGESTISTASQQAETLDEAPVPVTLITRQMIEMSGARTLQELLCIFVPGVSLIDGTESNIAMRGVYSQSQESVLIMLDGHRLNSQTTNAEAPDYRTSLDKIQQIEVLRGPASSLYGNVALTAVVNIITRRGAELDGHSLSLMGGSFHSFGGSYIYGRGNLSQNLTAWGAVYASKGEPVNHPANVSCIATNSQTGKMGVRYDDYGTNTRYVGGFNHKPAYDFGISCRWDDVTILFTAQQSKKVPYYNQLSTGDNYEYDRYGTYRGSSPGTARTQYMAAADYNHSWDRLSVKVSGYGMIEETQLFNVMADSLNQIIGGILGLVISGKADIVEKAQKAGNYASLINMLYNMDVNTQGAWEALNWSSKTFGGSAQIGYNYELGRQHGNFLAGVQYDYFTLTEGSFAIGGNFNQTTTLNLDVIQQGSERSSSAFLQVKHHFSDQLIFNGGFRLDHKNRIHSEVLNSFSPRVTFIWQPSQNFSTKFGYAHSFVDAPYLYRASNMVLYKGFDLKSEKMDAFQLSAIVKWPQLHLRYEGNIFSNRVTNLVYMDPTGFKGTSINEAGTMVNSGSINMFGLENVIEYQTPRTILHANMTLQEPMSVHGYPNVKGYVCNVPKAIANVLAARNLIQHERFGSVWLRGNLHYQSTIHMLNTDVLSAFAALSSADPSKMTNEQLYPSEHQGGKCIVNLGAYWNWHNFTVSLDCYNLFDTDYMAGGLLQGAVPQQSRSLLGKINITL